VKTPYSKAERDQRNRAVWALGSRGVPYRCAGTAGDKAGGVSVMVCETSSSWRAVNWSQLSP